MLAPEPDDPATDDIPDERLRLIFTCCHPALPFEARVAVILMEIFRGYEGPPNTGSVKIVGANLETGFK